MSHTREEEMRLKLSQMAKQFSWKLPNMSRPPKPPKLTHDQRAIDIITSVLTEYGTLSKSTLHRHIQQRNNASHWVDSFEHKLGSLKEFLQTQSDKFEIIGGNSKKYRICLVQPEPNATSDNSAKVLTDDKYETLKQMHENTRKQLNEAIKTLNAKLN
eukprot:310444_1